tara:strand:- start:316 stop:1449 length:1134 start_codon:yes stop_codon:yes gene_type:complete
MFRKKQQPLPKLTKMLNGLDANSKAKLKKHLLERQKHLKSKNLLPIDELKHSPIMQHIIEAAVEEAESKKKLVLESVDDYINEYYDGKVEDFNKNRPAALLDIEIRNVETMASEVFKRAKDIYTEVLEGWPIVTNVFDRKNRKKLKVQYETFALLMREKADFISDDVRNLQNVKERKTIEVASDVGGAKLIATLESLINSATEIMGELSTCAGIIDEAAKAIGKGRTFFNGKKADQSTIPIEAVQAALHLNHSSIRVMKSLQSMKDLNSGDGRLASLPRTKSALSKFLKAAARTASLTTDNAVDSLEAKLMSPSVKRTGHWWKVGDDDVNLPDVEGMITSVKKGIKDKVSQWNNAPPMPNEIQEYHQKLLDDITGPI